MRRLLGNLAAVAVLLASAIAYAGWADKHVEQARPPTLTYNIEHTLIEGPLTASSTGARYWFPLRDAYLMAVRASVRVMAGTITQFTIPLYMVNGIGAAISTYGVDTPLLGTSIDMYSTGLATAGTIQEATMRENLAQMRPVFIKAGSGIKLDVLLEGSNTPTATDINVDYYWRSAVGTEAQ